MAATKSSTEESGDTAAAAPDGLSLGGSSCPDSAAPPEETISTKAFTRT
jgi:hypothetical protein